MFYPLALFSVQRYTTIKIMRLIAKNWNHEIYTALKEDSLHGFAMRILKPEQFIYAKLTELL